MIKFFARFRKPIFISIVIFFLLGIFVGLGSYMFVSNDMSEAVAEVGGTKLPYRRFTTQVNRIMDRMREAGTEINDQTQGRVKQEVFQEMIVEELLYQQALKLGLQVTDLELVTEVHHTPAFQRSGTFDPMAYNEAVRYLFAMSPKQYEDWRRRSLTALKFRQFVYMSAKPSPAEVAAEFGRRKPKSKDFEKEKDAFVAELQQEKILHLLNFLLRQLGAQVQITSFLEQREAGR